MIHDRRYAVTLYHDEPEEAGARTWVHSSFYLTERQAINAACSGLSCYWQTATIDAGEYDPGQLGIRPPHFTIDRDALPLRVGLDWTDR